MWSKTWQAQKDSPHCVHCTNTRHTGAQIEGVFSWSVWKELKNNICWFWDWQEWVMRKTEKVNSNKNVQSVAWNNYHDTMTVGWYLLLRYTIHKVYSFLVNECSFLVCFSHDCSLLSLVDMGNCCLIQVSLLWGQLTGLAILTYRLVNDDSARGVKVMAPGVAQTRRWLQVAPQLLLPLMAHCLLLGSAFAAEVEVRV